MSGITNNNGLASATDKETLAASEQHYFSSYDHFSIHEEMLKDKVRTLSYRQAIFQNRHLFKDKVVLDVGCGTGILSMFAARAGAKHVIAVDMSSIISMADKVIKLNGLDDKITLLQGKLEDVEMPYPEVDIIISEWMGYFLLYESMLDTVLVARDKYLKKGGLIFPDKSTIYLAGIEDGEYKDEKINFWNDVYGFDYSPFIPNSMAEPLVDCVESHAVNTSTAKLYEIDLNTVTIEELAFHKQFTVTATRDDDIHAFVAWFDIVFPSDTEENKVKFSTGPFHRNTHWKQTVYYLTQVLNVKKGEKIVGSLSSKPSKSNPRELDINIEWDHKTVDEGDQRAQKGKYTYFLR